MAKGEEYTIELIRHKENKAGTRVKITKQLVFGSVVPDELLATLERFLAEFSGRCMKVWSEQAARQRGERT